MCKKKGFGGGGGGKNSDMLQVHWQEASKAGRLRFASTIMTGAENIFCFDC